MEQFLNTLGPALWDAFTKSITGMVSTKKIFAFSRGLLLLLIGYILAKLASKFVNKILENRVSQHHQKLFTRLSFYLVMLLFLVSGLNEMGFQLSVLLGAAGILSVALGFASQTSASNLISGIFLLGERPFEVGDFIRVGSTAGQVLSIDLLSVKLRTSENLYVRIPNETLIKSELVNLSKFPIRRLELKIGIAYKEDISRARSVLMRVAQDYPYVLEEPKPEVVIQALGASSVDLSFTMWTQSRYYRDASDMMYELVKEALDRENIEIPFPHVSVYAGSSTGAIPIKVVADAITTLTPTNPPQS
ncbi:MAG TPA: mechanosensitive ion channel family protein [Pseudomonadales bacterium]|nr:mechanosensitive ion channel family protein [Pseudomonadales bacterium]